jgi:hypothetical protein
VRRRHAGSPVQGAERTRSTSTHPRTVTVDWGRSWGHRRRGGGGGCQPEEGAAAIGVEEGPRLPVGGRASWLPPGREGPVM